MINGDNLRPKETFDNDPHAIALPSLHPDTGEPTFRVILEKGLPLTLKEGNKYTPLGVIAVNQTNRIAYVNAYVHEGFLFVSIIIKDDE